jgi:methylmalonyl-CoA mutase N-terminal domain/subunit
VLALPTEKAARIALRPQLVVGHETRVTNVPDPLGGSYFVEALTDEIERRAEEVFAHLARLGDGSMREGVLRAIEEGWFQREIGDSAYELERKLNDGRHLLVGVNVATDGNDEPPPDTLHIGPEVEEAQLKRLAQVRADRDGEAVDDALDRVRADASDASVNLMPALLDAVATQATVGEVIGALADIFGRYREDPVI